MKQVLYLFVSLSVFVGSFLLAEQTGHIAFAVAGGTLAGLLEGLFQTRRLFAPPERLPRFAQVVIAVPKLAAIAVILVSGVSWLTIIAYAAPWILGVFAIFTWDAHKRGA